MGGAARRPRGYALRIPTFEGTGEKGETGETCETGEEFDLFNNSLLIGLIVSPVSLIVTPSI